MRKAWEYSFRVTSMLQTFIALIFFISSGCTLPPVVRPGGSQLHFPPGTYYGRAKIEIKNPKKVIEFKVVVESRATLRIMGISRLGSTDFRFEYNWTSGKWSKELYEPETKRYSDEFLAFFSSMRDLFSAPQGQPSFEKRGAKFDLFDRDENQIFRRVLIDQAREQITLEFTNYEF